MIEMRHVQKTYPNGFTALHDVNLTIDQGEYVAVIGLSGAGKSTLIRTINRMIDISDGKLTVDGTDVSALSGKELRRFRRNVGMNFQSFNLVTRTKVISNVLAAKVPDLPWWRSILGLFPKSDEMEALKALDQVGIANKAFTRVDQLSGGQQQRVALARALMQNPKILLADEPVASLDPVTAEQVMGDFGRINRERNITVIINIHHVDLALRHVNRVIGIRAGEVVYDGGVDGVNDDVLRDIYGDEAPELGQAPTPRKKDADVAAAAADSAEGGR